ncbi:MAG: transglycosylase domain-containing protein [Polaromonas sp.]|nr:transglycosylase domain-containing protein [Polaromonas sp.]
MNPALQRVAAFFTKPLGIIRRHPVKVILLPPALGLVYVLALIPSTPSIGDLRKAKSEVPSVLLASDGTVLAEYKRSNRQWVTLDKISPNVVNALIATEDRRFYEHHGIDFQRLAGAAFRTLTGDSVKIESAYSKSDILEIYLNTVPFLYNAFGIEMAARTYFDKPADKLNVLESATLIGMLKGTSYYNPVQNPERARKRRNTVLAQMVKYGKLDATKVEVLAKRPLKLEFERQTEPLGDAPHVAQHLRKWLISWADGHGYDILADGLRVRTTIDVQIQKLANQAVARQMAQLQQLADGQQRKAGQERAVLQAGFLALDPRSGAVRAWVGSRDFSTEQFDHVSQARRQPGSTFKPFVYGAAFMQGLSPSYTFIDEAVSITAGGGEVWTPSDSTPPTGQPMTLREGLSHSKNTITAQLMQKVGPARVAQLAQAMGVRSSPLEAVPSLALGTSPVTLLEMVSAYGTIANGGNYLMPVLVDSVEDRNGQLLEAFPPARDSAPAMPRADALTLVDVMRGVIDEGTGQAIRSRYGITADVAGKTGTTQNNTDGWFIMMNPQLVAGARVGFNDNSVTMGNWGQGARSALPMVGEVFQQAFRSRLLDQNAEFAIPRPRPAPPPEPQESQEPRANHSLGRIVNDWFGRIFR